MKRLLIVLFAVVAILCTSVNAAYMDYDQGYVLYHQDFAHISDFTKSGIKVGLLSTKDATYSCGGDSLAVKTDDGGRSYLIFPETDRGYTYTVEFSFRFTDVSHENGYLGYMLTCRGNEPNNITHLTFRANGSIDDFEPLPEEMAQAIAGGEEVKVTIPVENGVLYHIIVEVGGTVHTAERNSMIVVGEGNMGLLFRYIGVEIPEIYVVNGVDYTEKIGNNVSDSYASDEHPVVTPGWDEIGEGAPATYDHLSLALLCLITCGVATVITAKSVLSERKPH
ncbi:MAG: hypothetical protein E7627_04705 [Ruminococcaceae bacterium]|nr:hypothetical protein [Oscillospiraceae bacterium]